MIKNVLTILTLSGLILSGLTLVSCKSTGEPATKEQPHTSRFDAHMDAEGPITQQELMNNYPIFAVKRQDKASAEVINAINMIEEETQIRAFFGTWCHDSQREIPYLLQLMQSVDNHKVTFDLVGLDRQKQESTEQAKAANIKYTPTIVVYQNGKELGRIVEKTSKPIGQELLSIIDENQ